MKKWIIPIFISLIVFCIYCINLPIDYTKDLNNGLYRRMAPSSDVIPNTFLPYLLIKHKSLNYDHIFKTMEIFDDPEHKANPYFLVPTRKGHVNAYPIVTGLFAVPIYFVPLVLQKIPEVTYHENIIKVLFLGRISASFFASISVMLFYLITTLFSKETKKNLVFTFYYAFGTGTYSVSSRGLWMHTISQLLFSLILFVILIAEKTNKYYWLVGFLLGLAVINRPTSIVFALVICAYVFWQKRSHFIKFCVGAGSTVILLLTYNYLTFGNIFVEGYSARGAANVWEGNLLVSIPGYFISPARGYLFISPILLLGFYGIYRKFKQKDKLFMFLGGGYLLSMLMMAKWYTWHGANAFGSRMLVDYLPFIALFSFLIFIKIKKPYIYIVYVLMLWSIFVHTNAVVYRKSRCSLEHNWSTYCLQPPNKPLQY